MTLSARAIAKSYGAHRALTPTSLEFAPCTITAIVGGNGAGKSTLLNLLGGVTSPSRGGVWLDATNISSVRSATLAGISYAHQENSLVPDWTVAQHFPNADRPWRWITPNIKGSEKIASLPAYDVQCLEIARAIALGRKAILADEPTATLSADEREKVMRALTRAASDGRIVVWVTHDLDGALVWADRIVVLRDGAVVSDTPKSETNLEKILAAMGVGEATSLPVRAESRRHDKSGALVIKVNQQEVEVRPGEILGLTGSAHSPAKELLRATIGLRTPRGYAAELKGRRLQANVTDALRNGIVYLSRERGDEWLFSGQSVAFNVAAGSFGKVASAFGLTENRLREYARPWTEKFEVKATTLDVEIDSLSGGNRQKAVLARLSAMHPSYLLLDEPFSGVDRPTRGRMFELLRMMADSGAGIAIYSQEIADLLKATDKVLVLGGEISTFDSATTEPAAVERALVRHWGHA